MIQLKRKNNYTVIAQARHHDIISDVKKELGGGDHGLNPHEILEASLGACTAITILMYANRKQISLEDVQVEVQVLSEGSESVINRKIKLIGNLSDEQRKRLMEIADLCPIHKLLKSNITIQNQEYPRT